MGYETSHEDEQWELIEPLLPATPRRGHEARGDRQPTLLVPFLRGILWKLRSGARWELCRNVFLPIRLYTDGCNIGEKQAHLKRFFSLHFAKYSVGARKVGGWTKKFYRRY